MLTAATRALRVTAVNRTVRTFMPVPHAPAAPDFSCCIPSCLWAAAGSQEERTGDELQSAVVRRRPLSLNGPGST